jgi:molybdenum cofactor cytidylyltransferase
VITVIILAAGESRRMGRPKMLLPWKNSTVLGQVLATYQNAGVHDLLVVTGGARQQVEQLIATHARTVFNQDYATGDMLGSIQCGIQHLDLRTKAILIALGDQPLIQEQSVRMIIKAYTASGPSIVVPSFQHRRGHPWLVSAWHWPEILCMRAPLTMREFLQSHRDEICYVEVDDPGVLQDLDTPEDYQKYWGLRE